MAIIASAIFGRSAFTFGRIRIIRFISSEERCPLNMIYKHALVFCVISLGLFALKDVYFASEVWLPTERVTYAVAPEIMHRKSV